MSNRNIILAGGPMNGERIYLDPPLPPAINVPIPNTEYMARWYDDDGKPTPHWADMNVAVYRYLGQYRLEAGVCVYDYVPPAPSPREALDAAIEDYCNLKNDFESMLGKMDRILARMKSEMRLPE